MAISLPKIQVGRFLRKSVAPLVPGGAEVAERVNSIIKDVKTGVASGQNVIDSTRASITEANVQAEQRKYLTIGVAVLFALLLVYLARRR